MTGTPNEEAVIDYIQDQADTQIEFLQELIRAQPVNPPGNEEAAAELIRPKLVELGFDVTEYEEIEGRPNIVAQLSGNGTGPTLLTNAHLDVVPVQNPDAWPCDPFSGEIVDGRMFGRGAVDHKSPIVAMLTAIEALQSNNIELAGDLIFIFDSNEERGGEHGMRYVVDNADIDPDMGIYAVTTSLEPDAANYFSEAGRDNIFRANYGNQVFRVEVDGHIEHPLAPAETDGAGARLARILPAIQTYCDETKEKVLPLVGHPDAHITTLESEGRPGRASPAAVVHVHRYYGPSEDADDVYAEFEEHVETAASDIGIRDAVTVDRIKLMSNVETPEDHPLVKATVKASEQVRGRPPTVSGIPAQAGITWLVNEFEIPMILFGYGNVNLHHAEPEWIEPQDVIDTSKAYTLTYMDLLGASTSDE